MKIHKTQVSYAIEVTINQFLKLEKWEKKNGIHPSIIGKRLEAIPGVSFTEMNGHFGPFLFITVEAEHDNKPETQFAISAAVKQMIKESA